MMLKHSIYILGFALSAAFTPSVARAQDLGGQTTNSNSATADDGGWFVRGGPVGIFFSPAADLSVGGAPFRGADVTVNDNYSVDFDLGYRINRYISTTLTIGIPPTAKIRGAGTLAGANLGKVTYGPAILAAQFRIPTGSRRFEPYIGGGLNYTVILKSKGRDVANFDVSNAWGPVLQGGVESMISDKLGIYVDVRKIWLKADISGNLGVGGPPATGKATLSPLLVGAGVVFRF